VPVAGGTDRDVAGCGVALRATVWDGDARLSAVQPTVVLLHGLASQRRFWNLVVPHLVTAGVPVVAIDQRGHGDSERPDGPYDVGTCARDVLAVLDDLGVEDGTGAVVVGHSWGASVALEVAAAAPERVRAAVAVDGGVTTPAGLGTREEVRRRLEPPRFALPPEEFAAMVASGPLAEMWTPAHEAAVVPAFAVDEDGLARARLSLDIHMKVLDGLLDVDVAAVLSAVRCPCWAVVCEPVDGGAQDAAYHDDAWARARAEGLDRAGRLLASPRVLRWAGAVHDVPLQWPALVAGLVLAAYDEVGPDPSGGSA
jgi:pimeloyl-ACP methyl ester carboxylesterase